MSRTRSGTARGLLRWKATALLLAVVHFVAGTGLADEPVVAHLKNGRKLTGVVDAQTTTARLWLRLNETNIVAHSSVDWRDVARVQAQGRNYSADEFRPQALRQKSDVPNRVFANRVAENKRNAVDESKVTPRVQSFRIEAELANWDRDAEVDGFEVHLYPLDAARNIVPVNGMVNLQLIGQNLTPDLMFEPVGENYSRLERYSERISRDRFEDREVVVRLPFRRIHPEFEVDVRIYGQLNASLSVDGQGIYDATVPVIMRSYSPLRERLQQYNRSRFFPGERTGNFPVQHIGIFPGNVTGR